MNELDNLPSGEKLKSSERVDIFSSYYDGLHIRLLLGKEALDPEYTGLTEVKKEDIKDFEQRRDDYQVFSDASTRERQKVVGVAADKLDEAVDNWSQRVLKVLGQDFTNQKNFDSQKAQRWRETLNLFLTHLGIDDISKAGKDDIRKKIYERYFKGETKNSDLYQFIDDVLKAFNNDFDLIRSNIDVFQWFSGIFGIDGSQLTTHLLAAEIQFKQSPDEVVRKANFETQEKDKDGKPIIRANNLNTDEKKILEYVGVKKDAKDKENQPTTGADNQASSDDREEDNLDNRIELLNQRVIDKEHIFYRPKVRLFGDLHGKGAKPIPGYFNVGTGDFMDPKYFFRLQNRQYGFDPNNFRESINAWMECVKKGEGLYILGNHDVKFLAAMLLGPERAQDWLNDGGDQILEACEIQWQGEVSGDNYDEFRKAIMNSQNSLLREWYDFLLRYGKCYAVVNDVYLAHTIPVTKDDGSLFDFTQSRKGGMEAFDEFEKMLREIAKIRDRGGLVQKSQWDDITKKLAAWNKAHFPQSSIYGPFWVRDRQWEEIRDDQAKAQKMIDGLNEQARKKGGEVKKVVFGHIQEGGGVFCNGMIINIDYSYKMDDRPEYYPELIYDEKTDRFVIKYLPSQKTGSPTTTQQSLEV
ncbi:MAG: hypothetical protein QHH09_02650 [Microgenomates group bacterium]|nr:hypothetical protein [Microgenomates group bacterium]